MKRQPMPRLTRAEAPNDTSGRARHLQRMRMIAAGLLGLMAAIFLGAGLAMRRVPPGSWPALGYLRAFAEAGVVGACADWFAVTALFRRPLGLPIPHTAIIARNKDRIGQALGRFIADNFLTVGVLNARLQRVELADWGAAWLRRPSNAWRLSQKLSSLMPSLLQLAPTNVLRDLLGSGVLAAVEATPAAPVASRLLTMAWSEGQAHGLIDRAAELLGAYLDQHQEVILEKVQSQSYKWLPTWVDKIIAKKITAGVIQLLADVQDRGHPWRTQIDAAVQQLIMRLAQDPELREQGEVLKRRVLNDPQLVEYVRSLWSDMEHRLNAGVRDHAETIALVLEGRLVALGDWLARDRDVQRALNTGARALVRQVIAPRRHDIGRFVAQVVSGWDARSIVERLELQVGPDLQYIRINGTLVGGLVGLTIYAAARALGLS